MAPTARPATRPRWAFFGSDTSLYLLVVEATGVAAGYLGCPYGRVTRGSGARPVTGAVVLRAISFGCHDLVNGLGTAGDALQQQADDDLAHPGAGLVDAAHRHQRVGGDVGVVVADHGDVCGAEPEFRDGLEHAEGELVVAGEDRRRAVLLAEQLQRLLAGAHLVRLDVHDARTVLEPELCHREFVAAGTDGVRGGGQVVLRLRVDRHVHDVAVPEVVEVTDGEACTLDVVVHDGVVVDRVVVAAEHHQRRALREVLQPLRRDGRRDGEDPVDLAVGQHLDRLGSAVVVRTGGRDDQLVAGAGEGTGSPGDDLGEEVVVDRRDLDADGVGRTPHRPGRRPRPVAQLADGGLHTGAHLVTDAVRVPDDLRDRCAGDTGGARDVLDGDRALGLGGHGGLLIEFVERSTLSRTEIYVLRRAIYKMSARTVLVTIQ